MKGYIFAIGLIFLLPLNSFATTLQHVNPAELAGQILYNNSNTLCGEPVAELVKLQDEIRKIPDFSSNSQKIENLFKILESFLAKNKMPITGGCHPGSTQEAINPEKLSELAMNNKNAISEMEKIVQHLRVREITKGVWYYYLSELAGVNSPLGKSYLDLAYQHFSKWYETEDGGYYDYSVHQKEFELTKQSVDDVRHHGYILYRKIQKLKDIKREPMIWLIQTEDNCGYGTAFWIRRKDIKVEEEDWLKKLLSLAHNCCFEYPMVYPRPSLDEVLKVVQDTSFRKWAGSEIVSAVDLLIKDYPDEESVHKLPSEFMDSYMKKQRKLLKLILKRFKIQQRDITGGNC